MLRKLGVVLVGAGLLWACEDDAKDAAPDGSECAGEQSPVQGVAQCQAWSEPLADDYVPGVDDDAWPPCISDDGTYQRVQQDISTIARVEAFDDLRDLLFDPTTSADADAFAQARVLYQQEEGLDSRVVRRYDPHYVVAGDVDCTQPGIPACLPNYCVGPGRIQPLVLDALNAGIAGEDPVENAARVEAGLMWFLYVSTFKEGLTCTTKAKDCDSAYAYYTGGGDADTGKGLAAAFIALDPELHAAAFRGALAVRCWRDLDPEETATDTEQRDRARMQYDRALRAGMVAILADRARRSLEVSETAYQTAFVRALLPALEHAVAERASDLAPALQQAVDADPMDVPALQSALTQLADCP